MQIDPKAAAKRHRRTHRIDKAFRLLCAGCTYLGILILFVLLGKIVYEGVGRLDWAFLSNLPSGRPSRAGLKAALLGSLWLLGMTAMFVVPVGVSAAIFLEEYGGRSRFASFLETNISNLAGVPSIVYGILGLAIFVRFFAMGPSLLAGALTLGLLVLPIVIVAAREALRAVPPDIRLASYGLGATRWQTTWKVVLPNAIPGILTGVILALSRAIGETAPLILVGAATFILSVPDSPMDQFTALPIQIYGWASETNREFRDLAASGIIVLLLVLFFMNGLAIFLRQRFLNKLKS